MAHNARFSARLICAGLLGTPVANQTVRSYYASWVISISPQEVVKVIYIIIYIDITPRVTARNYS